MIRLTDSESEEIGSPYAAMKAAEARYMRATTEAQEARGLDEVQRGRARAELEEAGRNLNEANAVYEACERAMMANRKAAK